MLGSQQVRPVIGGVASDSIAARAGLEAGEEITEAHIATFEEVGIEDVPTLDIDHINVGAHMRNTMLADKVESAEHALVVYGRDGMDEVSLGAATLVGELKNGQITEYEIHPEDFGLSMASNRALKVETPEQSREMLIGVLKGEPGAAQDIVCLNAGVALYAANVVDSVPAGLAKARAVIASGAALAKLEQVVTRTHALATAA